MNYRLLPMNFIVFCKTYRNDILRAKKLLDSVRRYNSDHIPLYFSIPKADLAFFKEDFPEEFLVFDEDIVLSNPRASLDAYYAMPGQLSQQIIKAEAWRKIPCDAYLCIDADSYFTKPFSLKNFMADAQTPYTIMHENEDFLRQVKNMGKEKILHNIENQCAIMKAEFHREGKDYDFGPSPLIWSRHVWASLDKAHFLPRGETIWDAVKRLPHEIIWYGEALLKYQAIPLHPVGPLMFCFHYDWQVADAKTLENYVGIVSQSNWDKTLDPAFCKKSFLSRLMRSLRRMLGRVLCRIKK